MAKKKKTVEESTEVVHTREVNVPLFEKRITLWACTGMLGFLCLGVINFQNDFSVLKTEVINAIKVMESQNTMIQKNALKIAQHDVDIAVLKTGK